MVRTLPSPHAPPAVQPSEPPPGAPVISAAELATLGLGLSARAQASGPTKVVVTTKLPHLRSSSWRPDEADGEGAVEPL